MYISNYFLSSYPGPFRIGSFLLKLGYFPNLKNARTFNEKILFRKQNKMSGDNFVFLSDKYLVRDYVRDKIGDQYFVPLMFCTDSPEQLFDYVPHCDVILKPNHGAGCTEL